MEHLQEITKLLENVEGYQIAVATLKEGKITHSLFTETFPLGDMLKSHAEIKKLIISELEKVV